MDHILYELDDGVVADRQYGRLVRWEDYAFLTYLDNDSNCHEMIY